jgi:hypothetical protein
MMLEEGREASGVALGDLMMGTGRVTGWLTPFRYEETAASAKAADGEPWRSRTILAEGREASGVALGDLMMGTGRVTGWLTPFR